MSRTDHFHGLTTVARAFVAGATELGTVPLEGLCNTFALGRWRLPTGQPIEEQVQHNPWSSGPYWFTHLVWAESGLPVEGMGWSEQAVADTLGESYGNAYPTPSAESIAWWQELIDRGSLVPGLPEDSRTDLHWADEAMMRRAVAQGVLRVPPGTLLRIIRHWLDMDDAAVALALGVEEPTIVAWAGGADPGVRELPRLRRLAGIALEWARRVSHPVPAGLLHEVTVAGRPFLEAALMVPGGTQAITRAFETLVDRGRQRVAAQAREGAPARA